MNRSAELKNTNDNSQCVGSNLGLTEASVRQSLAQLKSNEWPALSSVRIVEQAPDAAAKPASKRLTPKDNNERGSVVLALIIHPELSWFTGHYPTMPILAGIAQVHIAAGYGRHTFSIDKDFTGLDAVKFTRLIEPDARVDLSLSFAQDSVLRFRFTDDEHTYSSGRILFANS